jgi:LEA14-like dessication related protein
MLIPKRLLLLSLSLWMMACSLVAPKFEKPNLSVVSIQMVGGNFLQQNFLVKFNIQNPNDRALPVTGLHAELNAFGQQIATGVSNRAFVVPALGETQFDVTITANMAVALLNLVNRSDKRSDSIDYDMTGSASIDLPFLHDVPFHQHGSLSLRMPQ